MYYGRYEKIRDLVWQSLLDSDIAELPADVIHLCVKHHFALYTFQEGRFIVPRHLHFKFNQCRGFCYESKGRGMIFYDENMSRPWIRYVIAHEIGHLLLGHVSDGDGIDYFPNDVPEYDVRKEEAAAHSFAMRLLAPAFVLHELGLTDANLIAMVCGMPILRARQRAKRLKDLERREQQLLCEGKPSCFGSSDAERILLERFRPWIEWKKQDLEERLRIVHSDVVEKEDRTDNVIYLLPKR